MQVSLDVMFWSFIIRAEHALLEAAPTILFGLLTAGVLRRMARPSGVRSLFAADSWATIPRAWLLGMLLPVCSFGVLPVLREMRRCGLSAGTILAFALAAPLINPISLLYGMTLSEPLLVLAFVAGSLIVSVLAGLVWTRLLETPTDLVMEPEPPAPAQGWKRMISVLISASKEATGPMVVYIGAGLIGVGLLGAVLPFGILQSTMRHDDALSPLLMTGIAIPAYVSPIKAMMIVHLMFEHGNSVGASFLALVLGAGANLGLLAWIWTQYRGGRTLAWLALVLAISLGLAYACEAPMYWSPRQEDHTHAFDDFSSPFPAGTVNADTVIQKLTERQLLFELVSLGSLVGLVVLGIAVRGLERRFDIEAFLCSEVPDSKPKHDLVLSPRVLAVVGLLGLAVFGLVGAYLYYPDSETVFTEMASRRADAAIAVRQGRAEEAMKALRRLDDLSRKLQVGIFLRGGNLTQESRTAADDFREILEEIHDALARSQTDEARKLLEGDESEPGLDAQYRLCRTLHEAIARADAQPTK